jgi:hypothetical protein
MLGLEYLQVWATDFSSFTRVTAAVLPKKGAATGLPFTMMFFDGHFRLMDLGNSVPTTVLRHLQKHGVACIACCIAPAGATGSWFSDPAWVPLVTRSGRNVHEN